MTEITAEGLAEMQAATRQTVEAFAALRPVFDKVGGQIIHVGRRIDAFLWDYYREAGQPYGPNYKGRDRWLVEKGELARAQEALTEARVWEEALADVRRLAAERKVP